MARNRNPFVSIAIPTYNRAHSYLQSTLESALSQTYDNFEIIVSDNCSTDHTERLVKQYRDNRIRYFKQPENIGLKNNFNFCVQQAKGRYFLLLCDDDLIDSDFIETCASALEGSKEAGVVVTGTRIIDEAGKRVSEHPNYMKNLSFENFFINWFSRKTVLYMSSTLYNTKYLKELDGFHSKTYHYQDVVTTAILSANYGRIDIQGVKASFREHSVSKSKTYTIDDWITDSLYLLDVICTHAPENNKELRRIGLVTFARKNYGRARNIPSLIERWKAYILVNKKFDYKYSPFNYWKDILMSRGKSIMWGMRRRLYKFIVDIKAVSRK